MAFGNEKCKEIVENICPYCGEILIMNKRTFANHVRWCKKNPRYAEIKESCISKLKSRPSKQNTYIHQCEVCGNDYEVKCTEYTHKLGKYRKTCCNQCAKQLTVNKTDTNLKNKKISISLNKGKQVFNKFCPYCKTGKLLEKTNNETNEIFYLCENYNYCRYSISNEIYEWKIQ